MKKSHRPAAGGALSRAAGSLLDRLLPCGRLVLGFSLIGLLAVPVRAPAAPSGFSFLRLPVSARSAALGGAGATFLTGADALHANPAGLSDAAGEATSSSDWGVSGDVSLIHHEALAGLRQDAITVNLARDNEAVALGFNTLYSESIELRDEVGRLQGSFGLTDILVEGGYARTFSRGWQVGGTVGYVSEDLAGSTANTWLLGAGARLSPPSLPGLSLAAAVRHFGPDTEFRIDGAPGESFSLPLTVAGGAAYARPFGEAGTWLVVAEATQARDEDVMGNVGLEIEYSVIALRGGARLGADEGEFTAGLGVRSGSFRFDYAFVSFGEGLGDAHRAELSARFGL